MRVNEISMTLRQAHCANAQGKVDVLSDWTKNPRRRLSKLDVQADGDCGAHCLAVVKMASDAKLVSPLDIRMAISQLAVRKAMLHDRNMCGYADRLKGGRFLEHFDLALYLQTMKFNLGIFAETADGRVVLSIVSYSDGNRGWVFMCIIGSQDAVPHFQIVCHAKDTVDVRPVFTNAEAREIIQAAGLAYPEHVHDPMFSILNFSAIEDFIG